MKRNLLKKLDRCLGLASVSLLKRGIFRKKAPTLPVSPASFLLIRPGGIGDAVLLIPAIQAIKRSYPFAEITVLAEKRNEQAFALCREVHHVLAYDRSLELLAALRKRYDVVIDTEQWYCLSAVVARCAGSPVTAGFATNGRDGLYTYPVSYAHEDYEMDSFFHLLQALAIPAQRPPDSAFLSIPESAAGRARELLKGTVRTKRIALFTGSSLPEKQWPVPNFKLLVEKLQGNGYTPILLGGKDDMSTAERIADGGKTINLAGKTTLTETAAVVGSSSLLVSGDSGVLHIASGLGISTVALFGPSNVAKWAPRGEQHKTIARSLPCAPCSKFGMLPRCSRDALCMSEITVEEVMDAVTYLASSMGVPGKDGKSPDASN